MLDLMLDFPLHLTYSLLPWILLLTMQKVIINNIACPIAHYIFLVAMDTIMNNAVGKYQYNVAFPIAPYSFLVAMDILL